MPQDVDTTEEPTTEPEALDSAEGPESQQEARQPALRRAAVPICIAAAAIALAAGAYVLLAAPPRGSDYAAASQGTGKVYVEPKATAPAGIVYARPVRLRIPKIGLDAEVEKVGLTSGDAMGVPSRADTVAWYKGGSHPGNVGTAVIDGHSGYADGSEAAFDRLTRLGKGDKLYVEDAKGRVATFIVRKTRLYSRNSSAASVFAATKARRLNLITCTGSFDVSAGTHSERLVVFAELKPSAKVSATQ